MSYLTNLQCLDGQEITESERAEALAELPEVRAQLLAEKAQGIKMYPLSHFFSLSSFFLSSPPYPFSFSPPFISFFHFFFYFYISIFLYFYISIFLYFYISVLLIINY
jgi:hypothetical protein